MNDRFKPYAAALIFFLKDDSVLLTRRFNTGWADGTYSVPSGHIENNENITDAAIREAKEEVGVTIDPTNLSVVHVSYRKNNESNRTYVDFFLVCTEWTGDPQNCEPNKCDDVRWFKLTQLPDNTTPFILDALSHYKNGGFYSEVGWNQDTVTH